MFRNILTISFTLMALICAREAFGAKPNNGKRQELYFGDDDQPSFGLKASLNDQREHDLSVMDELEQNGFRPGLDVFFFQLPPSNQSPLQPHPLRKWYVSHRPYSWLTPYHMIGITVTVEAESPEGFLYSESLDALGSELSFVWGSYAAKPKLSSFVRQKLFEFIERWSPGTRIQKLKIEAFGKKVHLTGHEPRPVLLFELTRPWEIQRAGKILLNPFSNIMRSTQSCRTFSFIEAYRRL